MIGFNHYRTGWRLEVWPILLFRSYGNGGAYKRGWSGHLLWPVYVWLFRYGHGPA